MEMEKMNFFANTKTVMPTHGKEKEKLLLNQIAHTEKPQFGGE